jgi:hypothetical protein
MRSHARRGLSLLMLVCSLAPASVATPLTLEYCVSPRPDGRFDYNFTLTVTDADGTFVPGQSFNWIVFGDSDRNISPLADFVGEDPAPGPWTDDGYNFSTGTHNGPCLIDYGRLLNFPGWTPTHVGQSLTWRGHSAVDLQSLAWSNILGSGEQARFEPAVRTTTCLNVTQPCAVADFNADGGVDGSDLESFYTVWMSGEPEGDVNLDGGTDGADVEYFITFWMQGGC